jgi:NAD(P)-dependent dehydrogenase (short-subunit alcohol dehydrogenase family)
MARLKGKKIVITGAAQGLGECFAHMMAAEGAKVFLTDIQEEKVRAVANAVNKTHPGLAGAAAHDVCDEAGWKSVLAEAASAMGGISVLVNNAGIASMGSIEAESFANYRRCMAIDLDSVFLGSQTAMPYLKDNQPGSIVNISSVAGLIADGNLIAYNTAKAGLSMMSKSIAIHCARSRYQITCNSVHPVFTRTPIIDPILAMGGGGNEGEQKLVRQIPMKRLGEPEEVGHMVVYLASDEAKFVTAAEFVIDGGISAV